MSPLCSTVYAFFFFISFFLIYKPLLFCLGQLHFFKGAWTTAEFIKITFNNMTRQVACSPFMQNAIVGLLRDYI